MDKIFEIAASVSTPLALGGLVATVFFFVLKQILAKNIFPKFSRDHSSTFLTLVVNRLFVLALVAMVLGFAGYVWAAWTTSKPSNQSGGTPLPGPATPRKIIYKTCRDKSFGREGWEHTQVLDQSSGWRGGGGSQTNYCAELSTSFIQTNSIGSDREVEVLTRPCLRPSSMLRAVRREGEV